MTTAQDNLRYLYDQALLPRAHYYYLLKMRDEFNIYPNVIYDIGSCVLHWTYYAKQVWPQARIICFEAMQDAAFLYEENNLEYHIGLLSDQDGKQLTFYENTQHPGGNSYYRENEDFSPDARFLFSDHHAVTKTSVSLDTVVRSRGFPPPDLIKMDIQGAELDVIKGALSSLEHCKDLILELQHVEYNKGAPNKDVVIDHLAGMGYKLITPMFSTAMGVDGDYHFRNFYKS